MYVVFGLTLAEEVKFGVTVPVVPSPALHGNTRLGAVLIIGLKVPPLSEQGAAAIRPLPGVSVQADPGLLHSLVALQSAQHLLVLTLTPHTDQICVVLPAVALSLEPTLLLGHQHILIVCIVYRRILKIMF